MPVLTAPFQQVLDSTEQFPCKDELPWLQSAPVVADAALPGWQPLPPLPEQASLARATMDTRFFDTAHTPSRVMDVAEHPDARK